MTAKAVRMGNLQPLALASARTLEEAAQIVLASLPTDASAGVWVTEQGQRRQLAGAAELRTPTPDGDAVEVTAHCGTLVEVSSTQGAPIAVAAVALAAIADRLDAESAATVSQGQLGAFEALGGLGSYDWHVREDRLEWSRELFRIYGEDPERFEPSYARFLERVHPDERASVRQAHEQALTDAAPFRTEERIVRADGSVRTLSTYGTVLTDRDGVAVRMFGVCRDITEEVTAREDASRAATRLQALVSASPDAILVVDLDGIISHVNPQAEQLFGYLADQLIGTHVDELVPRTTSTRAAASRDGAPATRTPAITNGADLEARRADGDHVAVDIVVAPLEDGQEGALAVFVRDVTPRRQAEQDRRRAAESEMRRRHALELNDNVVQGLVALLWELDEEDVPLTARRSAERTLTAAQQMMSDLLQDVPGDAGGLVRVSHLVVDPERPAANAPGTSDWGDVRVVLADDAPALRMLLRARLATQDGLEVVGEAADGQQAVELCQELSPDLVLLDVSMPVLDGLQAAQQIRQQHADIRIYAFSGYPADAMRSRAMQAGADGYYEKTNTLDEICDAIAAYVDERGHARLRPSS